MTVTAERPPCLTRLFNYERPDSTMLQVMLVAPWHCAQPLDWRNCGDAFIYLQDQNDTLHECYYEGLDWGGGGGGGGTYVSCQLNLRLFDS